MYRKMWLTFPNKRKQSFLSGQRNSIYEIDILFFRGEVSISLKRWTFEFNLKFRSIPELIIDKSFSNELLLLFCFEFHLESGHTVDYTLLKMLNT